MRGNEDMEGGSVAGQINSEGPAMFSGWLGVILCVPGVKYGCEFSFSAHQKERRVPAENLCSPAWLLSSSYVSEKVPLGERRSTMYVVIRGFAGHVAPWPVPPRNHGCCWSSLSGACMSLARCSLRERRSKHSMALETNMQL